MLEAFSTLRVIRELSHDSIIAWNVKIKFHLFASINFNQANKHTRLQKCLIRRRSVKEGGTRHVVIAGFIYGLLPLSVATQNNALKTTSSRTHSINSCDEAVEGEKGGNGKLSRLQPRDETNKPMHTAWPPFPAYKVHAQHKFPLTPFPLPHPFPMHKIYVRPVGLV